MYTHMRETDRHTCMHVSAMPHPSDTPGNRGAVTHPTPDVSPCYLTWSPCLLIRSFYFMAVPSNSGQEEWYPHESLPKIASICIWKGSCCDLNASKLNVRSYRPIHCFCSQKARPVFSCVIKAPS
jgi:hypothetical protein